jgi:histone acetyltransferase 1
VICCGTTKESEKRACMKKRIVPVVTPTSVAPLPMAGATEGPVVAIPPPPLVPPDPFVVRANEALSIRFVASRDELEQQQQLGNDTVFHPAYTHQVFTEDERIRGYRGLALSLFVCPSSFRSYLGCTFLEARQPQAHPDPAQILASVWPAHSPPSRSLDSFVADLSLPFTPPGHMVHASGDGQFEVWLADISSGCPAARAYHERVQPFVLLFIDGGSRIDPDELGWRCFYLYQHGGRACRRLLGFATAYEFYHYPDRVRLRISQVLVFPPYQRRGHGLRLVEAVYAWARATVAVADVTVEDPSDEFRPVRDLADLRALRAAGFFAAPMASLDDSTVARIRNTLKICKHQILKSWFVFEYAHAQRAAAAGNAGAMRQYRLRAKASIAVRYSDWLQDAETPEDRKRVLDEIYTEHVQDYTDLLLALDKSSTCNDH